MMFKKNCIENGRISSILASLKKKSNDGIGHSKILKCYSEEVLEVLQRSAVKSCKNRMEMYP